MTRPRLAAPPPAPLSRVEAHAYGRECAAHLLQWCKDKPAYVGQGIACDIDFTRTEQRGYWRAFSSTWSG